MRLHRLASVLLVLSILVAPLVVAPAVAQTPASQPSVAPPCDAIPAVVRLSEIKPGGMAEFMKAVAAHQAWYKAHGSSDSIFASRIYLRDPQTKAASYSETEVLTFHLVISPGQTLPENDDAWKAFVTMYKNTSTIKSEYRVCMPKTMP